MKCAVCLLLLFSSGATAASGLAAEKTRARPDDGNAKRAKSPRLLLLGQNPDRHPWSTHEYMDGLRIVAACLARDSQLNVILCQANSPWREGPELLDGADGAVLFLSEGARWLGEDPKRFQAFERLAARGGALVSLHWAMGCRDAQSIDGFVRLFGGCHGGPDRKYRIVRTRVVPVDPHGPIWNGIAEFTVEDEFYYRLKFSKEGNVVALMNVSIDGKPETVAWEFERPDGGRSFGFSGLHFHRNWNLPEYRRLVVNGILWTLKRPIPTRGANVEIPASDLILRRPKPGATP